MGNRRTDSNRTESRRRRLMGFLLMLLPGFMFVGLLAPAAVLVKPVAQEVAASEPLSFANFRYAKRPMLVRDSKGETPSLADVPGIGVFFSGARYVAQQAQKALQLPRFLSQEQENQIILDEPDQGGVEDYVADQILGEPEQAPLRVDLTPLWNPQFFDIIPPMLSRWGDQQYDDLAGPPPILIGVLPPIPVPEPRPALLVALGLVVLGLHRSAKRP